MESIETGPESASSAAALRERVGSPLGTSAVAAVLVFGTLAAVLKTSPYFSTGFALVLFFCCVLAGIAICYPFAAQSLTTRNLLDFSFARSSTVRKMLLALLLLGAGGVRLYGVEFGKPFFYHPDEQTKVRVIRDMAQRHSLNPKYFRHPSLLLYSTYAGGKVLNRLGINTDDTRMRLILAGRLVSIAAGVASVFFLYLIGARCFSPGVGLLAAAILAFAPLHVTCSRYVKEDVLCTCFVLAALLAGITAAQKGKAWLFYLSGLLAGVSAGSKYTGITSVLILGAVPWIAGRSWRPDVRFLKHLPGALLAAAVGFVATTPYSILYAERFIRDFRYEGNHLMKGHPGIYIDPWSQQWMWHFVRSLMPGMTLPVLLVGVAGIGVLLARRRPLEWLIVLLALAFYLPAEYGPSKPMPQPDRYVLPCIPFLALAAAECCRRCRPAALRKLIAFVLIVFPLGRALAMAADVPEDTRVKMARYVESNLPKGTVIALIGPIAYLPRISEEEFDLESFPVQHAITGLSVDELRKRGKQYLITSSFVYDRYYLSVTPTEAALQRFAEYKEKLQVVAEITAPSGSYGFHNPRLTLYKVPPVDGQVSEFAASGEVAKDLNAAL